MFKSSCFPYFVSSHFHIATNTIRDGKPTHEEKQQKHTLEHDPYAPFLMGRGTLEGHRHSLLDLPPLQRNGSTSS